MDPAGNSPRTEGLFARVDSGGHRLALFLRAPRAAAIGADDPEPMVTHQDFVCPVFAVEDVDNAHSARIQKGVVPLNEPHDRQDWEIRCFRFRDPEGNLIEYNQDLGDSGE